MKNKIILLLVIVMAVSCSKSDEKQNRNPFLTNPVVRLNLNLNLPEYSPLKFPGNYITTSQGIKGIVVYCVSDSQYFAYDLTDPNHPPSECSRMTINGVIATCPCEDDENTYNIASFGQHVTNPDKYPMQPYRAERNGNSIQISN